MHGQILVSRNVFVRTFARFTKTEHGSALLILFGPGKFAVSDKFEDVCLLEPIRTSQLADHVFLILYTAFCPCDSI